MVEIALAIYTIAVILASIFAVIYCKRLKTDEYMFDIVNR